MSRIIQQLILEIDDRILYVMMLLLLKLTLRAKGIENNIYHMRKQQSIGNFILNEYCSYLIGVNHIQFT